jgi:hypothetical protein
MTRQKYAPGFDKSVTFTRVEDSMKCSNFNEPNETNNDPNNIYWLKNLENITRKKPNL